MFPNKKTADNLRVKFFIWRIRTILTVSTIWNTGETCDIWLLLSFCLTCFSFSYWYKSSMLLLLICVRYLGLLLAIFYSLILFFIFVFLISFFLPLFLLLAIRFSTVGLEFRTSLVFWWSIVIWVRSQPFENRTMVSLSHFISMLTLESWCLTVMGGGALVSWT